MSSKNLSLSTVHELLRTGQIADAALYVGRLKEQCPELADLYNSKLAEIQRLEIQGEGILNLEPKIAAQPLQPEGQLVLEHLVFVTASCKPNEIKRRAIEATWGETLRRRGVRHYFVIGVPELDRTYRLGQMVFVPCRDDYESLLLKLALAYEYLLATEKEFTHVFKIDDDCYLNLPRFELDLKEVASAGDYIAGAIQRQDEPINRRWHFGKCSDHRFDKDYPHDFPPASYAKGGYGYLLSRHAMSKVTRLIPNFRCELEEFTYAYEDLRIGHILNDEGINLDSLTTYEVSPPSSDSILRWSVAYDISDVARFYSYHQELALSQLVQGNTEEFANLAYSEGRTAGDMLGFDHVYLVNLRCAVDRRTTVQWNLNREGVRYELFSAFNGQSPLGQEGLKMISDRPVGNLQRNPQYEGLERLRGRKFIESNGAVGYILTYVRLLLDAKKRGFRRILILEDDVFLRSDFRAHLARFLDNVSTGYKVLLLGSSQYNWDSVDLQMAEAEGHYQARALDTCGSFAIAINTEIADELIEELLSFEAPFDHIPLGQIYDRYPNECHVAYPNIVIPDVTHSYIREGRDQSDQAEKMRWPLKNFDYPRSKIRIGLVLRQGTKLNSPPQEDMGVDLQCYRATVDGLRPLHEGGTLPVTVEHLNPEQETHLLERPHSLPVDILFATQRNCDGSEVVMEVLDASGRFGAQDSRSREWLQPLQNKFLATKLGLAAVVIPTRGRKESLVAAIDSVLNQDYPDKEVIVVDENDGGDAISKFVHDHVTSLQQKGGLVRLITHGRPRNAAAARNTGLFATQAEFISFLDDDDVYLPGRLTRVIAVLQRCCAKTGGAYCGYLGWNSKDNDLNRYPSDAIPLRLLNLEFKSHYVCTPTVTYRREALLSVNGYDEAFRRHQDLELNIRVFRAWEIAAHPEVLVQLNPLPTDNSNKLYDIDLFEVKLRFLTKFENVMARLGLDRDAIIGAHVKEMANFTRNVRAVRGFALENPSRFSSLYLDIVLTGQH